MSYELWTRGSQQPEKIEVNCPECGTKNEVLWFPQYSQTYRVKGTTGASSTRTNRKKEKVEGTCKECRYKFKPDDLD
ncbi:MAG: hypothetical protein Q7K34_03550 [archaeon]|nr:hypothetical protein [archaeon]